jgi:UDP:flavonoid glycosyltransferase YjiC (YdhE family)
MKPKDPVSVLVAPLDWGLGHATRCIPIIKELIGLGARVIIAASGNQKALLTEEFPSLEFIEIPGYNIRYKNGLLLKWAILFRAPWFLNQIRRENQWLTLTIRSHRIDALISDNRYGLYNADLFTVFITHQLYIQSGISRQKFLNNWINRAIQRWNYKFIGKFSCCWVPDGDDMHSIAGQLSHPPALPEIPVKYVGILSRFAQPEKRQLKKRLLILLSGPEPARTRFENRLIRQVEGTSLQTVIVRGLPGQSHSMPDLPERVQIFNHLSSVDLAEMIMESEFIIARSGYSTIMDLIKLRRNAIIVPTPGQTEQAYLGNYMNEKGWMYSVPEKKFHLKKTIDEFQKLKLRLPETQETNLRNIVGEFLEDKIKSAPATSGLAI